MNDRGELAFDICPNIDTDEYKYLPTNDPSVYRVKDATGRETTYHHKSEIPYVTKLPDGCDLTFADLLGHFITQVEKETLNPAQKDGRAA